MTKSQIEQLEINLAGLEQYHREQFDKDHEEALRINELWDTLQSILDDSDDSAAEAKHAINKLRSNWIFKA